MWVWKQARPPAQFQARGFSWGADKTGAGSFAHQSTKFGRGTQTRAAAGSTGAWSSLGRPDVRSNFDGASAHAPRMHAPHESRVPPEERMARAGGAVIPRGLPGPQDYNVPPGLTRVGPQSRAGAVFAEAQRFGGRAEGEARAELEVVAAAAAADDAGPGSAGWEWWAQGGVGGGGGTHFSFAQSERGGALEAGADGPGPGPLAPGPSLSARYS